MSDATEPFYIAVHTEDHRGDHPFGRFSPFVRAENWRRQKRQYPKQLAGSRLFELCWVPDDGDGHLEITSEVF